MPARHTQTRGAAETLGGPIRIATTIPMRSYGWVTMFVLAFCFSCLPCFLLLSPTISKRLAGDKTSGPRRASEPVLALAVCLARRTISGIIRANYRVLPGRRDSRTLLGLLTSPPVFCLCEFRFRITEPSTITGRGVPSSPYPLIACVCENADSPATPLPSWLR